MGFDKVIAQINYLVYGQLGGCVWVEHGSLINVTVTPALLPPYGNEDIIDEITEKLS